MADQSRMRRRRYGGEQLVPPVTELPAALPFQRCPNCGGELLVAKFGPSRVEVECVGKCMELVATWNAPAADWKVLVPALLAATDEAA